MFYIPSHLVKEAVDTVLPEDSAKSVWGYIKNKLDTTEYAGEQCFSKGKYAGEKIKDVAAVNVNYLLWYVNCNASWVDGELASAILTFGSMKYPETFTDERMERQREWNEKNREEYVKNKKRKREEEEKAKKEEETNRSMLSLPPLHLESIWD